MPHIFEQANQENPKIAKRNITEIASITHYLFKEKQIKQDNNPSRYLGDPANGEKLFSAVGCMGCHVNKTPGSKSNWHGIKGFTKVALQLVKKAS